MFLEFCKIIFLNINNNFILIELRTILARESKRSATRSSHLRTTSWSERSRSLRSQSSILPNLWSSTRTAQRPIRLPPSPMPETSSLPNEQYFEINARSQFVCNHQKQVEFILRIEGLPTFIPMQTRFKFLILA